MSSTSAAELYYLRHIRSCAAAATGNKGGHPGQSSTLQISGADFIATLLQSTWRDCYITLLIPRARLLQSIWRMLQSIKLITPFLAMLQSTLEIAQEVALAWLSPLELAACLHLATADILRDLHQYHCEPDRCWVSAVTKPSVQEMAAIAIALLTLILALMDWHVRLDIKWQSFGCRILTAMCMHALRMDSACTVTALLLPTFGKRPQDERSAPSKRATTTSHATEQTEVAAMTPTTELNEHKERAATEHAAEQANPTSLSDAPDAATERVALSLNLRKQ